MLGIEQFRAIANDANIRNDQSIFIANAEKTQLNGVGLVNSSGNPRKVKVIPQSEIELAQDAIYMRSQLLTAALDKFGADSPAFKAIERELFGELVDSKDGTGRVRSCFDPSFAEKPLNKRQISAVVKMIDDGPLTDKQLLDEVEANQRPATDEATKAKLDGMLNTFVTDPKLKAIGRYMCENYTKKPLDLSRYPATAEGIKNFCADVAAVLEEMLRDFSAVKKACGFEGESMGALDPIQKHKVALAFVLFQMKQDPDFVRFMDAMDLQTVADAYNLATDEMLDGGSSAGDLEDVYVKLLETDPGKTNDKTQQAEKALSKARQAADFYSLVANIVGGIEETRKEFLYPNGGAPRLDRSALSFRMQLKDFAAISNGKYNLGSIRIRVKRGQALLIKVNNSILGTGKVKDDPAENARVRWKLCDAIRWEAKISKEEIERIVSELTSRENINRPLVRDDVKSVLERIDTIRRMEQDVSV